MKSLGQTLIDSMMILPVGYRYKLTVLSKNWAKIMLSGASRLEEDFQLYTFVASAIKVDTCRRHIAPPLVWSHSPTYGDPEKEISNS